jgi:hypothetical protein
LLSAFVYCYNESFVRHDSVIINGCLNARLSTDVVNIDTNKNARQGDDFYLSSNEVLIKVKKC